MVKGVDSISSVTPSQKSGIFFFSGKSLWHPSIHLFEAENVKPQTFPEKKKKYHPFAPRLKNDENFGKKKRPTNQNLNIFFLFPGKHQAKPLGQNIPTCLKKNNNNILFPNIFHTKFDISHRNVSKLATFKKILS